MLYLIFDAFLKNAFSKTESFKDLVINSRSIIPQLDFRTWNGHLKAIFPSFCIFTQSSGFLTVPTLNLPLSSKKASVSQKDVTPSNPLRQVLLETTWDQNQFVQATSKDFKTSPAIFLHGCHSLTRETMMIR